MSNLNNCIKLKPGSFFLYIEKDWFERFKPFLANRDGVWLPKLSTLPQLGELLHEYIEWDRKESFKELRDKSYDRELLNSVISEEEKPKQMGLS